ncbi:MAG: YceI family protein [Bryobacteraceae bacterium]
MENGASARLAAAAGRCVRTALLVAQRVRRAPPSQLGTISRRTPFCVCSLVLTWIAICALPLAGQDTVLTLDPARTTIRFMLHDPLHTVHGTFKLKSGTSRFNTEEGSASGAVVADVASGESGNGARDRRMHKSILESRRYPEAVFTPRHIDGKVPANGTSQLKLDGIFRLHGADHALSMEAQVERNGNQLTATMRFTIPYVAWGLKNPSTLFLRVDDRVEMDIAGTGVLTFPQ